MKAFLYILAAAALFGQAQTPLKVEQNSGSTPGQVWLQEPRGSGTNYVKLKAQAMSSDVDFTLPPTTGSSGQCLTTDGAGVTSWATCTAERTISDYNWSQVIGARSGSGTLTLTFTGTSCPAAGTDSAYVLRVYETVTPTTYELATSNGTGTCTRGGSGTIVATGPTGTYTNATATSASSGAQEAIFSVADSLPISLRANDGGFYVYSDILTEDRVMSITCASPNALFIPMRDNVKVFSVSSPSAARIYNCGFNNAYAHSGTTAIYFNNPDGSTFGGLLTGNVISYFNDGIHLVTGYNVDILGNRFLQCDNACIWLENVDTGDAGLGLVEGNNLSCATTCAYGILWNSPGAVELKNNRLNGFTQQITLDPSHGYAHAANSGADTVITWDSGNRFRSSMVGQSIQVGTGQCTVTTYTSSTVMRCNGTNLGTISSDRYYVGGTGQAQVFGNLLDGGANTTYGIRWLGNIYLINAQIEQNFVANYSVTTAKGISIEGAGVRTLSVKNNNIQSSYNSGWTTKGIDVTAGAEIHVGNNQISGYVTALNYGSSALYITSEGNRPTSFTTPIASAASTAMLREGVAMTYAQLNALTMADGSTLYCSDCKETSATSATCTSGGSGAMASRLNGATKCVDGARHDLWTVSGSDIYYNSTGNVGIHGAAVADLSITGGGAGANILLVQDGGANTTVQLFAENGYGALGTYTAHDFLFQSDSTTRWRLTSAGMWRPEANDTYDIGLTGTRVRAVYAKFGEFYKSGSTASSDYLTTRKYNILDQSGGSGSWDIQASGSMAATSSIKFRDHAGSRWLEAYRAILGAPLNYTSVFTDWVPAKRDTGSGDAVSDSVYPKLGGSGSEWAELWVGLITASGNITGSIINATGSPAYRVGGTTVISSARAATFTDLTIATASAPTVGYVWTATSTGGAGAWQASSGSSLWTTSGSDIYYDAGNVGIGTGGTVSAPLHIKKSNAAIIMEGLGAIAPNIQLRSSNGSFGSETLTASGDRIGQLSGAGWTGAYTTGARIGFFAGSGWGGANAETYILFSSTANGATSPTARWRVASTGAWQPETTNAVDIGTSSLRVKKSYGVDADLSGTLLVSTSATISALTMAGNQTPGVDGLGSIGTNSLRYGAVYGYTGNFAGAVTMSGSTITASSTFSSDLIATTGSTYALGSSSVRWLGYFSTANVSGVLTLGSTITGDLIPTTNNTYINGSSSSYWNQIAGETVYIENSGRIRPRTGNTGSVGGSALLRFNKGWFTDMDLSGTVTAPNGNTGVSATKTVRDSAGTGTCTLIFSGGLLTGGTC